MPSSHNIVLTVDPAAYRPFYQSITPSMWPLNGASGWLTPTHTDPAKQNKKQVSWTFEHVPASLELGYLVLFAGRRVNHCRQVCTVFVGDARLSHQTNSTINVYDRSGVKHCQFAVSAAIATDMPQALQLLSPPPLPPLPIKVEEKKEEKKKDAKSDVPTTQTQLQLQPLDNTVTRKMIQGCVHGIFAEPVPLTEWLYRACQEGVNSATDPTHFTHLARWFLHWREITEDSFRRRPWMYGEVLQFVVGHPAWSYAYCADECMDKRRGKFDGCDSFNSMRWLPAQDRAGDCEDLSAAIATSFYALCDVNLQAHTTDPLLTALVQLARVYTCLFTDTVIRIRGHAQLHAYVKLIPTSQVQRLLKGEAPNADEPYTALFLDSTHRSWTPERALPDGMISLLKLLHRCLRGEPGCDCRSCAQCRAADYADMFTWPTPLSLWQEVTHDMYQMDLRYYEPRGRKVMVPLLQKNERSQRFGLPASHMDGREWEQPTPDERFRLIDVSDKYLTQGCDAAEAKLCDPVRASWPPVPGLQMDPTRVIKGENEVPETRQLKRARSRCVPVFLRDRDYYVLFPNVDGAQRPSSVLMRERLTQWLQTHCKQQIVVVCTNHLYLHAPDMAHFVFFVRAA